MRLLETEFCQLVWLVLFQTHFRFEAARIRNDFFRILNRIRSDPDPQHCHYRNKCCGSGTFWYGSGSWYFRHWPSHFLSYIYIIFLKIKVIKKSQKVGIRFFLLFLLHYRRICLEPDPDPYLVLMDPYPGGPKTYGSCGSGSWSGSTTRPFLQCLFFSPGRFLRGTSWWGAGAAPPIPASRTDSRSSRSQPTAPSASAPASLRKQ